LPPVPLARAEWGYHASKTMDITMATSLINFTDEISECAYDVTFYIYFLPSFHLIMPFPNNLYELSNITEEEVTYCHIKDLSVHYGD
jgi:hypothetical protein